MEDAPIKLPTADQLATLAALLGRGSQREDVPGLISQALAIWNEAHKVLKPRIRERWNQFKEERALAIPPCPKTCPVTRDTFARLMIPRLKKRPAELAAALKEFSKAVLERKFLDSGEARQTTPEEVEKYYTEWKPIENAEQFERIAGRFLTWWTPRDAEQMSEVRRNAALSQKRREAGAKAKRHPRPRKADFKDAAQEGLRKLGLLT